MPLCGEDPGGGHDDRLNYAGARVAQSWGGLEEGDTPRPLGEGVDVHSAVKGLLVRGVLPR